MTFTKTFNWLDFRGVPTSIIFKKETDTFTVEFILTITDETIADVSNTDTELAEAMWTGDKVIRVTKTGDNPSELEGSFMEGIVPFCPHGHFGGLFNGIIEQMRDSEEERVSDEGEETISIEDVEIFAQIGQL